MARMDGIFDFWRKKEAGTGTKVPVGIDLYAILGISPTATQEEIRAAFRELGKKFHPDRNPGDEVAYNKFIEISRAHSILSDAEQRAKYDTRRRAQEEPVSGEGGPLSTYVVEEKDLPRRARPQRKTAPIPWETFFPSEEGREGRPIHEAFSTSKKRPLDPRRWDFFFPERVVVNFPTWQRLVESVKSLPLENVWEVLAHERTSPAFLASKTVVVGPMAGMENSVEYDLAVLTGTPVEDVAKYVEKKGLDKAWRKVLGPLTEQAVVAIESLKPVELPGHFFADWDPSGRMIELLYTEARRSY